MSESAKREYGASSRDSILWGTSRFVDSISSIELSSEALLHQLILQSVLFQRKGEGIEKTASLVCHLYPATVLSALENDEDWDGRLIRTDAAI